MCDEHCCEPGPQGIQGVQGLQGPQGVPGPQGLAGSMGPAGPKGDLGPVGPAGAQGPVGPTGAMGSVGPKGDMGPAGPQGLVGPVGAMGPAGPQGPVGASGAQGPMGATGAMGPQGPAGPSGPQGSPGPQGDAGPQGPVGPMGPQGIQGNPGRDCECSDDNCCTKWYVSVYSLKDQQIASLGTPKLELVGKTSAAFDISMAPVTGEVKILKHGVYFINWGVDGGLTPPFPFPVPSWAFGVYKNGVLIPSSTSGSFTASPDDVTTHCSADFEVELMVGDVIKLVNICSLPINVVSTPLGVLFPIAAARMNIFQLVGLP